VRFWHRRVGGGSFFFEGDGGKRAVFVLPRLEQLQRTLHKIRHFSAWQGEYLNCRRELSKLAQNRLLLRARGVATALACGGGRYRPLWDGSLCLSAWLALFFPAGLQMGSWRPPQRFFFFSRSSPWIGSDFIDRFFFFCFLPVKRKARIRLW